MVLAGAGTGKTTTIVKKVGYLINNNHYNPKDILCLTFSNEATNNLRLEIQKHVKKATDVTVRTFHGFCADILKEFGHLIGIDQDFQILLPDDAKVWFYRDFNITSYNADLYVSSISTAKDFGISLKKIEDYTNKLKEQFEDPDTLEDTVNEYLLELNTLHLEASDTVDERRIIKLRKKELTLFIKQYDEYIKYYNFVDAWKLYEAKKKEKKYLDYSDLNRFVLELFERVDMTEMIDKYKYVIVDEFQDTNKMQFELIENLAKDHRNITVVGDQNQSIYGFRGAYKESFNHFKEVFKIDDNKDIFKFDKTFRSPNSVLRIAHKLILNNYEDVSDCVFVENGKGIEGNKIEVINLVNSDEEARKVTELVEDAISKGCELNQICVLYRTHSQGQLFRQVLESKNIPIIAAGKVNLLNRHEIKTTISYLSILNNLIEHKGIGEQAWWNVLHYHNTFTPGDSLTLGRYLKAERDNNVSVDDALLNCLNDVKISEDGKKILSRIVSKLQVLVVNSNKSLPDLVLDIYEIIGLNRKFTHERTIKNVESLMNLKLFYNLAESYYKNHDKSLSSFIDYLDILDELSINISPSLITDINAVRVMTIHGSKGLEFKKVIVTNLSEKRFPIERTHKSPLIPKEMNPDIKRILDKAGDVSDNEKTQLIKDYEKESMLYEERRLCYVAFTRASETLTITHARSYNGVPDSAIPSLFLREIEFDENADIEIVEDLDETSTLLAPSSKYELLKSSLKKQLFDSLDNEDFSDILSRLIKYHSLREGKVLEYDKLVDWSKVVDKDKIKLLLDMEREKVSKLKFNPENFMFSPTAILDYHSCPKLYELKHIFKMPGRRDFSGSGSSTFTGSFVHELLEIGVRDGYKTEKEFIDLALKMSKLSDWKGADLKDVNQLISVFFARNSSKYNDKSIVEGWLKVDIDGFRFVGKFDRIDFISGNDVEIIDYKTNKSVIDPVKRAWQLGFYVLAVKDNLGLNPVKATLDMLRLDKPYCGDIEADGNVTAGRSSGFNVTEVRKELVECARAIVSDYEGEFVPTEDESACKFCGYKFYCSKWARE